MPRGSAVHRIAGVNVSMYCVKLMAPRVCTYSGFSVEQAGSWAFPYRAFGRLPDSCNDLLRQAKAKMCIKRIFLRYRRVN